MEPVGHVEGMLDRDQRTIKLRFSLDSSNCSDETVPKIVKNCCQTFSNRTTPTVRHQFRSVFRTKRNCQAYSYFNKWKSDGYLTPAPGYKKLHNVLLVVLYLILVALPTVRSAPASNFNSRSRREEHKKWTNPCGGSGTMIAILETNTPGYIRDMELLNLIVHQAKIAYHYATKIHEKFTVNTFKKPFKEVNDLLKDQYNDWLIPPRSWRDNSPEENPDSLKHDDTLLDAYEYLQRIAVGLEQAVWDQKDGIFYSEFGTAEAQLNLVLCEMQNAIVERGIPMRADVNRDVMSEEFRKMNTTESRQRDFIILRDYINALDFIIQSFSHVTDNT